MSAEALETAVLDTHEFIKTLKDAQEVPHPLRLPMCDYQADCGNCPFQKTGLGCFSGLLSALYGARLNGHDHKWICDRILEKIESLFLGVFV